MQFTTLAFISGVLFFTSTSWATCGSIPASTPDSQLLDNGDYTITHRARSLMWKQCSEGQSSDSSCSGNAEGYTWEQALQIPESLNVSGGFAGYSDWRLPNIKELQSIFEKACDWPAINSTRFPNTPSYHFWSSTVHSSDSFAVWFVEFTYGFTHYNDRRVGTQEHNHVRLVRNAQ
jgi:hypothetical protein